MEREIYIMTISSTSDYESCNETPQAFWKFEDAVKAMDEAIADAKNLQFWEEIDPSTEVRQVYDKWACYDAYSGVDSRRCNYEVDINPVKIK